MPPDRLNNQTCENAMMLDWYAWVRRPGLRLRDQSISS